MKRPSLLCVAAILVFLSCSHALSPAGRLPVTAARIEVAAGAGIGASWRGLNDSRSTEWDLVHVFYFVHCWLLLIRSYFGVAMCIEDCQPLQAITCSQSLQFLHIMVIWLQLHALSDTAITAMNVYTAIAVECSQSSAVNINYLLMWITT